MQDGVRVDGALLLSGTMAHLPWNDSALRCFRATSAALQPGGMFVLMLPSVKESISQWKGKMEDGQTVLVEFGAVDDEWDPIFQVGSSHLAAVSISQAHVYENGSLAAW